MDDVSSAERRGATHARKQLFWDRQRFGEIWSAPLVCNVITITKGTEYGGHARHLTRFIGASRVSC